MTKLKITRKTVKKMNRSMTKMEKLTRANISQKKAKNPKVTKLRMKVQEGLEKVPRLMNPRPRSLPLKNLKRARRKRRLRSPLNNTKQYREPFQRTFARRRAQLTTQRMELNQNI